MPTRRKWNPATRAWEDITFRHEEPDRVFEKEREPGRITEEELFTWWLREPRFFRLEGMRVHEEYRVRRAELEDVRIEAYALGYQHALDDAFLPGPPIETPEGRP